VSAELNEWCNWYLETAQEPYVEDEEITVACIRGYLAIRDSLARVMSTLSKSAGSPEEQAVWREAWAVLAEYGRRP